MAATTGILFKGLAVSAHLPLHVRSKTIPRCKFPAIFRPSRLTYSCKSKFQPLVLKAYAAEPSHNAEADRKKSFSKGADILSCPRRLFTLLFSHACKLWRPKKYVKVSFKEFLKRLSRREVLKVVINDRDYTFELRPEFQDDNMSDHPSGCRVLYTTKIPYGIRKPIGEIETSDATLEYYKGPDYFFLKFFEGVLFVCIITYIVLFPIAVVSEYSKSSVGVWSPKTCKSRREIIMFSDVAGVDEAKEELKEIVDFLRNPDRYTRVGARPPRGVLMVGPPGTGKTLLAKAIAGEANVPFISCSGSEFVEVYVGRGASRVRELFAKAKKHAPSIVFIDEIDAVAKSRDSQLHIISNDEREQTLNQLLTEMDGFESSSTVIVLGATNRVDIIDPALRRPGRFDRVVMVEAPNLSGREAILKVHVSKKNLPLSSDVDLKEIATATTYLSGADLANLVNEAALLAGRANKQVVSREDFMQAVERSVAGMIKKRSKLQSNEKAVLARHEVGHAIVAAAVATLFPGQPQIEKLSILPTSGTTLGFAPITFGNEERKLFFADELRASLVTLLGGRAAEEVAYSGRVSTEALDDIKKATALAYKAVAEYGLNQSVGPVSLATLSNGSLDESKATLLLTKDQGHVIDIVQKEVQELLQSALAVALTVIHSNSPILEGLSAQLEENEKIDGKLLRDWLKLVVSPAELSYFIKGKYALTGFEGSITSLERQP